MEVAVNPRLRHPLILGTNWPAFKILLGVLCVDASCGKEKPEGEAAVRTGEAEPGPAEAAPGERNVVERLILTERDDFPLEQSQDESLRNAFDQVRGKWRGRSRARGDHQNPIPHSGPRGRSPLALPAHRCSPVAKRVCGCVLTPARANQPHPAPY